MRRVLIGLIGANIMKSLSPALHAQAFAAAGIDGYYHLMDAELRQQSLPQLFEAAKCAGFAGTNITFPFKQEVLALLDNLDPDAAQIGAVNTVTFAPDGRATGHNTDRRGFRLNFEEGIGRVRAKGATVVLVGAGGAGRAVAFALIDLGVAVVVLYDSDAERSAALMEDIVRHYGASRCRLVSDLAADVAAADGVINATPIGMLGFPGNPVPVEALQADQWAADVIYTPVETAFIKAAARKGLTVLTGGGMCVHQAAEAFRLFTGIEPDIAHMHRTFAEALAERDAAMAVSASFSL